MSLTLVTGGAGFVGRHLVRRLRELGGRVRVLDLAPPGSPDDIQGSVLDEAVAKAACAGVDVAFHLAGNPQLWTRNPKDFERVNWRGAEVMLAAARAQGVRRFIHCSTLTTLIGRHTASPSLVDEHTRLELDDMLGPYPRSKLLAERAVEVAAARGLDAVIAIPTEPLGPGDVRLTPPTRMVLDFVNGKTPAYIDCVLNFAPVESLADGFIAVRERGRRGQRYILGGENIDMSVLLGAIERLSGAGCRKRNCLMRRRGLPALRIQGSPMRQARRRRRR